MLLEGQQLAQTDEKGKEKRTRDYSRGGGKGNRCPGAWASEKADIGASTTLGRKQLK